MRYTNAQNDALAKASLNFMKEIKATGLFKTVPASAHATLWGMEAVLNPEFTPLNKRDRICKALLISEKIKSWEEL